MSAAVPRPHGFETVAVIGAGTMGRGIAQVAAQAGYATLLYDADDVTLERAFGAIEATLAKGVELGKVTANEKGAALERIERVTDVGAAAESADIVIEAIPEDLDAKREIFGLLDRRCDEETVLASNTSSLSIGALASATGRPERVVGIHFFNPVHIMRLVEVVVTPETDPDVRAKVVNVVRSLGKEPIVVRDVPGFASSRLGIALGLEAMRMFEDGVASARDIDAAMELGYNHPMGPLKLTDLVGLDVRDRGTPRPHDRRAAVRGPPDPARVSCSRQAGSQDGRRVLRMEGRRTGIEGGTMSSAPPVVRIENMDPGIRLVTIDRPQKMNALNAAVRDALTDAAAEAAADADVRVLVITGAGEKAFIAGADIGEFADRTPLEQREAMATPTIFDRIWNFPLPTIAMINGYCLGGGCELALACDVRIGADTARIGQPEVNLGIIPGGGGTQRLTRLVGYGKAHQLILTGEIIDAVKAYEIGLLDEIVPANELVEKTLEVARAMASKSPVTLKLAKRALRAAYEMELSAGLEQERDLFALAFSTDDKVEGVKAFLEKRKPEWKGR
jgi:enoyl-CoA hydratase